MAILLFVGMSRDIWLLRQIAIFLIYSPSHITPPPPSMFTFWRGILLCTARVLIGGLNIVLVSSFPPLLLVLPN